MATYGIQPPVFMTKNGESILIIRNNLGKNVLYIYNPKNDNIQDIHVDGRKEYIYHTPFAMWKA